MNTEIQSGPSFELGETHKLISASARDFAQQYIAPHVMDWDERQFFPKEL
jgi:alkylation response protein AidB-like acyl-CoA dehydrogenase